MVSFKSGMIIQFRWYTKSVENILSNSKFSNSKRVIIVNKIVLLASTVLTSAVLFSTVNISEAKADEVTANNAKHVAQQAMKNSGGNPYLQNFNTVKDKGDYYKIDISNKSGAGVGTYKVYKNGEVQYKSGNYGEYSTLNNKDCYTGQGITTKTYKETSCNKC